MSVDCFAYRVVAANFVVLRRAVLAVGALYLSILQSTPSLAESAYAFGQGEFGDWVSGYASNYTTLNEAQAAAMQKCMGRGIACSIIASFRKTCFAIAVQDLGNGWAVRYGPDMPSASRLALQGCATMGLSCSVKDTFCDSVSEQELQQAAIDQANRAFQEYQREWNECFAATQTEVDANAAIASCNQALTYPNANATDRDRLVRQRVALQGRIQEIRQQDIRAEQQRRQDEAVVQAYGQYHAQQEACEQYHEDACTAALRSPLADDNDRALLRANLAVAQHFKDDLATCRNGSVAACNIALASPAAQDNDRRYLQQWKEAASPFNKALAVVIPYLDAVRSAVADIPQSTMIAAAVAAALAFVLVGILMRQRRNKLQGVASPAVASTSSRQETPDQPQPDVVPAALEPAAPDVAAEPAVASKLDKEAIKHALKTRRVEFEL